MLSSAKEGRKGGRCNSGKVDGELWREFSFYKTFVRRRTWYASERAKQQKKARSKKKPTLHLETKNLTTLNVWVFILIKKVIYPQMLESYSISCFFMLL